MFFSEPLLPIKILSVLELGWSADKRHARPRPYHAVSYRITGNAEFVHEGLSTHVNQGDVAFVPAGYGYTLNSSAEHLYVVHFELYKYMDKKMRVFTPANKKIFENLFRKMHSAWSCKQIGYQNAASAVFYQIMEQIQKQRTEQKLIIPSEQMKTAVEYLHEHFADSDLSVAMLCEVAEMSDTYFRRLFIKNFSVTPLKYINNLRLSYAEELLKSGYYTVEQVAEKVGFSDPKYFSTFVKRETGLPPSLLFKGGT